MESAVARAIATSGPGSAGSRAASTRSNTSRLPAKSSVGQWISLARRAISRIGPTRPSLATFTPVKRPICPTRIETEMPLMKPMRIGRDRKLATTPSRSRLARKHSSPTVAAMAAATVAAFDPCAGANEASTPASTIVVPASGPTIR